jgi:hypothetical protein
MAAPTVQRGVVHTQLDTTLIKRDISEVIDLLDPFEVPMLDMVGKNSLHYACTQLTHEWIEDRLIPRGGTLGAAYVLGSGLLQVNTGEGKYVYVDDLIQVADLTFRVVAGPPDSDILTVQMIRGTDANVAISTAWEKISHSAPEGGLAQTENRRTVATVPYNYTQIMKDWAIITGTMINIPRYGVVSERAYNEEKIMRNLSKDLEKSLLYGVRTWEGGPPRRSTMGGLFEYVYLAGLAGAWPQVINLAGGDFSEKYMNDMLQIMWNNGGTPDFVMVNGTNKRRISSWITPFIRMTREERTAGAQVGSYESDMGTVSIVLNRNLRASDIIFGNRRQIGIGPLKGRQFSSRMLPSLGDYEHWEILGEYTMEVHKASVDFGWFYNSSTVF